MKISEKCACGSRVFAQDEDGERVGPNMFASGLGVGYARNVVSDWRANHVCPAREGGVKS